MRRRGELGRLDARAAGAGPKLTRIVLARGRTPSQPMLALRGRGAFDVQLAESRRVADAEAQVGADRRLRGRCTVPGMVSAAGGYPDARFFDAPDGVRLAYRELGEGRPVVLLHGVTADAESWFAAGAALAPALAERGHRVIMPDFRGHGSSGKPQGVESYPADVLTDDTLALVGHLKLDAYDVGGYSLGARIAVRMLVRGAEPRRVVVGGQGLREVLGTGGGAGNALRRALAGAGTSEPGTREARTEEYLRARGTDPVALLHVLDSLADTPQELVAPLRAALLVVIGTEDERLPSARELVALLPTARLVEVPGNHGTAALAPELTRAFVDFLSAPEHAPKG
ncbi:alpha/beta fold hydrolase [Streptacidiphilus melanogenes]|uniref:alpha/beta fold hydrolase n=1 Tax=Streptacidiphilus melanogenes TaxID=411235 RepID=UPI00191C5D43|nr:alpha/beta hydrolase [Streptacidiphilus melanogenes]